MNTLALISTLAEFAQQADGEELRAEAARDGLYAGAYLPERTYDELIGVCKGVLADGVVNDAECVGLHQWIDRNPQVNQEWPISLLVDRLKEIFEDGVVDDDERGELKLFLQKFAGELPTPEDPNRPTIGLCFDQPPPLVITQDRLFCFTGTFRYGTRKRCETAVAVRGGITKKHFSWDVDYLVVGAHATQAWLHSNYGTKIRDAIEARESGRKVRIVAEDHWVAALQLEASTS